MHEGNIGTKQVYVFECKDKQQTDSKLNPNECTMLRDFELYNVHTDSTDIEKRSIFSTEINCVEFNRKVLPTNKS